MDSTKIPSSLTNQATYEDFEPTSMWTKGESSDKLTIQLPGFKKEQLRVHLDKHGNLRISGSRPLDSYRWRRFSKVFHISDNYNPSEIRVKFENGILAIILPKLVTEAETKIQTAPEPQTMPIPAKSESEKDVGGNTVQKKEAVSEKQDDMNGLTRISSQKKDEEAVNEEKSSGLLVGIKRERKSMLINVVVAAIVLVGIAIYVAYQLKKLTNDIAENLQFNEF